MLLYGMIPGLLAGLVWIWFSSRVELLPSIILGKSDKRILAVLGFLSLLLVSGPVSMYLYSYKYLKSGDSAFWDNLIVLGIPLIVLQLPNWIKSSKNRINHLLLTGLIILIFGVFTPVIYKVFLNY